VHHGAHEERVAGVVAIHAALRIVQDPRFPVVFLEPGIRPILEHLHVRLVHVLRREVVNVEGSQLSVTEGPLADEEFDVRIRSRSGC